MRNKSREGMTMADISAVKTKKKRFCGQKLQIDFLDTFAKAKRK